MSIFSPRNYFVFLCALFLFKFSDLKAQNVTVRVLDPEKKPLAFSTLDLFSLPDTLAVRGATTDTAGNYTFRGLDHKLTYLLYVGNMKYQTVVMQIRSDSSRNIVKTIEMTDKIDVLKGGGIVYRKEAITQKNDTVEYNAGNYKVNQDATAENLITKMPGITTEGGTIKAQGEEVKKVTVDGQDFFGEDAAAALKNLPAEVIDKVQVFDRQSDQSQFTGIDDGNSQKTLNIVTKAGKNNGQFGKVYAGYGTDQRWAAGANVNVFKGSQRISLIGMSNNINQQNFSSQDILGLTGNSQQGGMMRGPGGPGGYRGMGGNNNFTVNQQGGINTTHAFGLNYSLFGGKKFKLTASYFFNNGKNETSSFLNRTYFLSSLSNQYYSQGDTGNTRNTNHKLNARLEYNIDSNNSIIFTPNLSFQSNKSNTLFLGLTRPEEQGSLINSSASKTESDNIGFTFSQNLLLRHKFKRPGQTISLNVSTSNSVNEGNTLLNSGNNYFLPSPSSDIFIQNTDKSSSSFSINPNLSYTHPIKKKSMIELTYNPGFNFNKSEKYTARFDTASGEYSLTDSLLSNTFDNRSQTQRAGLTYRYTGKKVSFNIGANVQYVELSGEQTFPLNQLTEKPFSNILPNAMFTYSKSKNSNLRIHYRTYTELPGITQLQNVINNSNPLLLSAGNAELRQEFRHNIHLRYSLSNPAKGRTFFLYSNFSLASDYLGNSTLLAGNDTTVTVSNTEINLRRGAQLSMPVNIEGYRSFRAFATYGMPIKKIKSTFNVNLGQTITRSPALINGQTNYSNTYVTNAGAVLASNISEFLDFTLSYTGNFNTVLNSLQSNLNNRYLIRNFNAKLNYLPAKRFVINADITNSSYTGLGAAFNQNIWLCNAGFGYKFLKDKRGEFKLSVFDALKQNTSISRTVSESYIEDKNTQILTRFYMLTFTYAIRHFKAKAKG